MGNELRDRIAEVLADVYSPGGNGPKFEDVVAAQAVIDDLGLEVGTQSLRWMDPNGPFPQARVVGRWERVE